MGQINSRHHNTESISQSSSSTVVPQSETVVDNEPRANHAHIDDEVGTTTLFIPKSSRRSSVGHSIRNLVSRSSSTARSCVDSTVSQTESQSSRRRWRTSRRWSKAPEELNSLAERSQEVVASVTEYPSEESEGIALTTPSNAKGKEKEDVDEKPTEIDISAVDRPPTPFLVSGSSSSAVEAALDPKGLGEGTSTNIGTWIGDQGPEAQTSTLSPSFSPDQDNVMFPSVFADETVDDVRGERRELETEPTFTPPLPSDTLPNTPQGRQFPPPGTLVVVQGVVHTTDVSRLHEISRPSRPSARPVSVPAPWNTPRRASSMPRPHAGETPAATGARNRLSALIPHPTTLRSGPTSTVEDNNAQPSSALAVGNESDSEPPSVVSDTFGSGDLTPASNETDISMASETDAPSPALSPSSIDVLGTLLSVAAAATAASLLTGSSDPIFTSGLNPATMNGNTPTSFRPPAYQNRPTSPTPIAGLGGLGSLSSSFGLAGPPSPRPPPTPITGHGNSRERIRHAWTSIRERLGRRSSNAASGNIPPDIQARTRPDGTPMGTRDAMLAEMARAFNFGLGLHGSGTDTAPQTTGESSNENERASDPPTPTTDTPGHPEPPIPEDSFDQFLINLQADLRVALSLQESPATQPPSYTPNLPSNETVTQPSAEGPSALPEDLIATSPRFPPIITDQGVGDIIDHSEVEPESVIHEDAGAYLGMSGASEIPQLRQDLPGIGTTMRSRTERRPGGGINWWRSYRFPPVAAPNAHGLPNTLNNANVASSPLSSTPPSDLFFQPSASSSVPPPSSATSSQSSAIPGTAPTTAENRSTIVVPVIVVGLQSVNMGHRRDHAPSLGDDDDVLAAEHNEPDSPEMADDLNFDGLLGDSGRPGTPRGRAWHSRAADAFRNLRPGRRASQIPHMHEGLGSRTFLIYVIGGYYPPDHSLITGVNALDSFEALWELAELLGQVKPQTVSKEEIDNSGLEIIKPAKLQQYEKEGKVASNCMERCLICLDDYEPEIDLRLLKCRHTFHKSCVDQWLQTGKNNCPACRTKGVSIGGGLEPATAATPTI